MTPGHPDRSKRVLAALVREYIASGEPVASSLLVSAAGLGVSSATVRNILARLEDEGYVQQPHTSAGRIPTDRGYRFYVDLLLESKRLEPDGDRRRGPAAARQPGRLLDFVLSAGVARGLAGVGSVGFALARRRAAVFDRVEFVPLSATRVLVVIVARGGHVMQKVIEIGEPLEHRRAAPGGELPERRVLRPAAVSGRARRCSSGWTRSGCSTTPVARAMRLATSTFSDLPDERLLYVDGAASLLDDAQGFTLDTLQALLQMIEEKQRSSGC